MSYGSDDDSKRKKRIVIIGVSSFLLVSMVVAVTLGVTFNKNKTDVSNDGQEVVTSAKAVQSICSPTDFKKTCEETLVKNNINNSTDPNELIQIAFNATMSTLDEVAMKSKMLKDLDATPRTRAALSQCKDLMHYAVDDLRKSMVEIATNFDMSKIDEMFTNIRVWLSAAISHEQACLDGFQDTEGDAGEKMKKALTVGMQLTRNGLAIVTQMGETLSQLDISDSTTNRRLLEDRKSGKGHESSEDFPQWVNPGTRRLLADPVSAVKPDVVVAKDGSGQFATIGEAVKLIPIFGKKPFVIYIKQGVYTEQIDLGLGHTNVVMIGDGSDKTKISGSKGYTDNITTYLTSPFGVVGDNFVAKNIGFENTAGAIKYQAVAIRVQSDMSVFYNCTMDGYQDTLYAMAKRQFYRDCTISGTIDFIFGDAAAVFQNCTIVFRKPLGNQQMIATAQGREDVRELTGYVLQGCTFAAAPEFELQKGLVPVYLARPWKPFSKTVIMNTFIPDFVSPLGYMPWEGTLGLDTLFYAEVNNTGPGANIAGRVTWPGIKKLTNEEAIGYLPANFIQTELFVPKAGVPYNSGAMTTTDVAKPVKGGGHPRVTPTPVLTPGLPLSTIAAAPVAAGQQPKGFPVTTPQPIGVPGIPSGLPVGLPGAALLKPLLPAPGTMVQPTPVTTVQPAGVPAPAPVAQFSKTLAPTPSAQTVVNFTPAPTPMATPANVPAPTPVATATANAPAATPPMPSLPGNGFPVMKFRLPSVDRFSTDGVPFLKSLFS